jgi:hypothetical protein
MNVYEMYKANKHQLGFWIVRETWGNTCAQVVSIKGAKPGKGLPGRAPYYGNPVVKADFYDLRTGKLINEQSEVSCPGTQAYRMARPSSTLLDLMAQANALP